MAGACTTFLVLVCALAIVVVRSGEPSRPWESYDPDDDDAWAAISPHEVSWLVVEPLEGKPAEQVIDVLGPPVHSRGRVEASARCAAIYLYPIATAGRHSTVGLCINAEGRVDGSVGSYKFHLRSYSEDADAWQTAVVVGVLIGTPLTILVVLRRRRHRSSAER